MVKVSNDDTLSINESIACIILYENNEQHNQTQVPVSKVSSETFRVSPKALMPPPPPLSWPQSASSLDNQILWNQYAEKFAPFFLRNSPTGPPQPEIKTKTKASNKIKGW